MSTLSDILLIGRNPDVPLDSFDGRVAAIIGDYVCTTPNQSQIFLPPLPNTEVQLRADVRYGADDPTLWPQPWVEMYCHLGAIPRKPNDSNDPLSIMWWDPTRDDFKSFSDSLVDGLGELLGSKLLSLRTMMSSMEDRIEDHRRANLNPNNLILLLVRSMEDAFTRLKSLKTTFSEMRVGVTEFQRYYLEIRGCLDYLELYKPRMDGTRPRAETVANCVGAITHIPPIAQHFHAAGLPVWLLRPSKVWDDPVKCNILEIVTPIDPADVLCVSQHYPPFPPIFYGAATDPKKHGAIYAHSRKWLVFKDPFGDQSSGSTPLFVQSASTTQSASTSQSTSVSSTPTIQSAERGKTSRPERSARGAPYPKPRAMRTNERNKFSPLDSPYAPYPIPAWSTALQAVDQSPSQFVEASKSMAHYGHYVFPDPGLFIHPTTAPKYMESWLRVHEIWFMRVAKEPSLALSNQSWRTFLSIDNNAPKKGETNAARRRQESLDLILPDPNIYPEVVRRSNSVGPIVWQGREFPPGMLPPENVAREILWELCEVNFIHELQSLDRRACGDLDVSNPAQLLDREILISQCFRTGSFRHVPIPSENHGLADDDFDKRFRFIVGLALVVKSWKGQKPAALINDLSNLSRSASMELEIVVAKYYCQQFFNYFGRAAQIPHRLFALH